MSTKIQWTDETWNPVTGCTRVSEGCRNCYIERTPAFRIAKRKFVNGTIPIILHHDRLDQPKHWKKRRRVFVNSLSDLFHDDVPEEYIVQVFTTMANAQWFHGHQFQVLTKRPERMKRIVEALGAGIAEQAKGNKLHFAFPLHNIWLGVSVEDQKTADERIRLLLQTPATVRWISLEPMLGSVNIKPYLQAKFPIPGHLNLKAYQNSDTHNRLDWVVVGGESGPGARPCDLAWIRSIKDQCQEAGVPVFVKQLGANIAPLKVEAGSVRERLFLKDKKGGDMAEWPEDLRVRQWPAA